MLSAYQSRRFAILATVTLLAVLVSCGPARAEGLGDDAYTSVAYGETDDVFQTVAYDELGDQDAIQETIVPKDDFDLGCSKCAGGTGCYCGPKWGVRAGALALFRARPDSAVLFYNALAPATNLNAADYDFGYKPGLDLSVMRKFDGAPDIEFRYMGTDAWTARAGLTTAGTLTIGTALPIGTPNSTVNSAYGSELDSFELNLRASRGGCVTWLLGFRYIELDEAYRATLTPVTATLFSIDTRNRLYGAQVGAEVVLLELDRLKLDFVGKAGIFGNNAGQNSLLRTVAFPATTLGTSGSGRAAFVGEAHVAATFCLVGNLSARVSYGVMGVTDVALASDQMAASNFFLGTGLNNNGNAFYHGGFVGLDFAY